MTDRKIKSIRVYRIARYVIYRETMVNPKAIFFAFATSFMGIAAIGLLQSHYLASHDNLFLIGSFGASAVLIYGIPDSPLARVRNVVGGHLISAVVGVTVAIFFVDYLWFAAALAVATSIVAMQVTKTMHPPGGATGLIACIGSPKIIALGYMYVITPVLSGVLILVLIAALTNKKYITKPSFLKYKRNLK